MAYAELNAPTGFTVVEGQSLVFNLVFRDLIVANVSYSYKFSSNTDGTASYSDFNGSVGSSGFGIWSTHPQTEVSDPFSIGAVQDALVEGSETVFLNISLWGIQFANGDYDQSFEITIVDNSIPQGGVTLTGTATEDQVLNADASALTDADGIGELSYQWLRNGAAIGGATAASYALDDADVGAEISVQVFYTDSLGTFETVTSIATAAVDNVNDAPQGDVTITGTAREGQLLTANTSALSDADTLGPFAYQWLRDGVAITGANSAIYKLLDADISASISVQVSYTDGHGTSEVLSSVATAAVESLHMMLVGGSADDALSGAEGNDTLIGNAGNDTLSGNDGNDGLFGGDGHDVLLGGNGDDTIAGAVGDDVIDGDGGNDMIGGGAGNDHINGGTGNDIIGAGHGDDIVGGGAGNDIVNGGAGNDSLDGGNDDDTMGGSFGNDTVNGGSGNDDIGGGAGSDSINAGAGHDSVGAGEGNDTIDGGAGNDFLAGGGRHDVIQGGVGDDTINGGDGDDVMTGGAGADVFVFNGFKEGDMDVISDWTNGEDSFRMSGIENAPGSGLTGYLAALDLTEVEGGVQMSYQGHEILLEGVARADLGLEDFTFL